MERAMLLITLMTLWGGLWLLERDSGIPLYLDRNKPLDAEDWPWVMIRLPRAAKVALYGVPIGLAAYFLAGVEWPYAIALSVAASVGYSGGHFHSIGVKTLGEGLICAASGLLLTIPIAAALYFATLGWTLPGDWLGWAPVVVTALSGAIKPVGYVIGWAIRPNGSAWSIGPAWGSHWPGAFAIGSTFHGLVAGAALGWALGQ
jgi:hypothetical protein